MLVLNQDVPWPIAFPTFALAGFGMGLAYSPLALIVLSEAAAEHQGAASSSLSLTDMLGTALGTGVSGAIVAAGIRATASPMPGLAIAFAVADRRRAARARPDGPAAPRSGRRRGRLRGPGARRRPRLPRRLR